MEEYEYTEHWMQRIVDRLDRLIAIGERVEGQVRLPSEEEAKTFSDVLRNDAGIPSDAVAEEPAKEAEPDHPAGPQPDPGEGYRLVNDSDIGKIVEVLDSLADPWRECTLLAINWGRPHGFLCRHSYPAVVQGWRFARIKIEEPEHPAVPHAVPRISPGEWLDIRDAYRDATAADVGKLVYVRNGEIESWIELRLAEVRGSAFPWRCRRDGLDPSNWQAFRYAVIRNEEPTKEAEPDHPAGPMPDPGEGYRILAKNPPEDLQPGDELMHRRLGGWHQSIHARWGYKRQDTDCWYRRKIEPAKPAEPEYREPVLPGDAGKECEFSDDNENWDRQPLWYWRGSEYDFAWVSGSGKCYKHARIKKDA